MSALTLDQQLVIDLNAAVKASGVFLVLKNNNLYKVHNHYKHLDPEDGLHVLLKANVTMGAVGQMLHHKVSFRQSNRHAKVFVAYVYDRI